MNTNYNPKSLVQLRHELHKHAELSNQEVKTAQIILSFIKLYEPDQVFENIGGHGLVFYFSGKKKDGLNIAFRADIDALPIDETIEIGHGSLNKNVAHKCGHDGHTVMVAGIAEILRGRKQLSHSYYLIFQPAEEIGSGASDVVSFFKKQQIKLDYIIGLHNLPGFKKGQIVARSETFAPASTGLIVSLDGQTSHAAEPENGLSPAKAMSEIILELNGLTNKIKAKSLVLLTIIQAQLGEIAFGTSPGHAEVRATLRANLDEDLKLLMTNSEELIKKIAAKENLKFSINYTESFPSTTVSEHAYKLIEKAAGNNLYRKEEPFKWSEDFGHYKSIGESIFFGLGAGLDCPKLHNENYDFPDDIIPFGIKMYEEFINILESESI